VPADHKPATFSCQYLAAAAICCTSPARLTISSVRDLSANLPRASLPAA
jgi:hypothetical protein